MRRDQSGDPEFFSPAPDSGEETVPPYGFRSWEEFFAWAEWDHHPREDEAPFFTIND